MRNNDVLRKTLEKCFIEVSETSESSLRREEKTITDDSDFSVNDKNKIIRHREEEYNPNLIFKKGRELSRSKIINKKNPPMLKDKPSSKENKSILNQDSNIKLRGEKLILEEENSLLKLEKEKILTIKDNQISTLNEKLTKLEIEKEKLNEICEFSRRRLEEYNPKVVKYDELYEKYSKLLSENENNLQKETLITSLLQSVKKEKEEISSKYEILRIENEALKNDKFYLTKESMTSGEKLQYAQDKIKTLEEDIREIRKVNQSYLDKLTEKNLNIETSFEERLRKEAEEMRRKYDNDKENLKKLFEDLAEKRCLYLNEEKEEYKLKVTKLEKCLKDKDESIDFINSELRSITKKYDEETAFLRIQLKIKTEELERLSNLYEENNNLLKVHKLENESLKDKIDLLRSEIIRKEADFKTESSELKSQMAMLKEKVTSYEVIEDELDKVIVDSAALMQEENEVMNIIKDIPTSSKRRISQCLVLANKLKLSIIEIEKLKDMNKRLELKVDEISEEKDLFKNVSEKIKQPQSYLLKNLQDMEVELYRKDKLLNEKDQSVKSLLRENDLLNEKIKAMESDMKIVLNNRKKLDNLEDIISQIVKNDSEKFYSSYKINENVHKDKTLFTSTNLNMMSRTKDETFQEFPERDTKVTSFKIDKVPKWYLTMKSKKI